MYKASHHIKRLGSFLKGKRGVRGSRVEHMNTCPSTQSNATVHPVHHVHSAHIRLSCVYEIHYNGLKIAGGQLKETRTSTNLWPRLICRCNCARHSEPISGEGICRIIRKPCYFYARGGRGFWALCEWVKSFNRVTRLMTYTSVGRKRSRFTNLSI